MRLTNGHREEKIDYPVKRESNELNSNMFLLPLCSIEKVNKKKTGDGLNWTKTRMRINFTFF